MRVLVLTNSSVSDKLVDWLSHAGETVFTSQVKIDTLLTESLKPDFVISYNYRYIIGENIIKLFPNSIINLHISLLPWNRGAYPNVWSFLDGTPKGVTIHLIDKGLDTGDIIVQKEVKFNEQKETLASSYSKLHQEILTLFKYNWSQIKNHKISPKPQDFTKTIGSIHKIADFDKIAFILRKEKWDLKIPEFKNRYKNLE